MFYVYVLRSKKDDGFYIGFTSNLKRRIIEHNSGGKINAMPLLVVGVDL